MRSAPPEFAPTVSVSQSISQSISQTADWLRSEWWHRLIKITNLRLIKITKQDLRFALWRTRSLTDPARRVSVQTLYRNSVAERIQTKSKGISHKYASH